MNSLNGPERENDLARRWKQLSPAERQATFRSLYDLHAASLNYYLLRMTGAPHLADDFTQEAFLKALQSMDTFAGRSAFKTWLYSIATNLVRNHLSRRDAVGPIPEDAPSPQPTPADAAEQRDEASRVRAAVDALPEDLRMPLLLVRVEDMKYREAAEALGVSVPAVRMRIYRAHIALAEALKQA